MASEPATSAAQANHLIARGERYCHSLSGLNRLLEVTRVLAEELDLAKMLETIAAEACIALRCERAIVYQYDVKRQSLFSTAGRPVPLHLAVDQGIPDYAAVQQA